VARPLCRVPIEQSRVLGFFMLIMYQEFKRTIQIVGEMVMFQQLSSLLNYIDRQVERRRSVPALDSD
jgi:hypothetical protein